MTLLIVLVGAMFLAVVVSSTIAYVMTQRLSDARIDILELKVLLAHVEPQIHAADKLANHTVQAAAHRSSDSFTGEVPLRHIEVARNDFLEKASKLAREYRVAKGEVKPLLEINEDEFRNIGASSSHAPAEIKDGSWREL